MAFVGGTGNDVLIGTIAAEKLRGFAGDDLLDGRGGLDSLYGDTGNDILYYRPGALISGGADIDTLRMDYSTRSTAISLNFTTTNLLVTGIEVISGALSGHNDVIRFGAVEGTLAFNGNRLDGGDGFDTISFDYRGLATGRSINMSAQLDYNQIDIFGGQSLIGAEKFSSFEQITLRASNGNDHISFSPELDSDAFLTVFGEGGDDTIGTDQKSSKIYGGDGNDHLGIYPYLDGASSLFGGAGNDIIGTIETHDIVFGGAGIDQLELDLNAASSGVKIGNVTGGGYRDFETYFGVLTKFADDLAMRWQCTYADQTEVSFLDGYNGNDSLKLDFSQITLHGYSDIYVRELDGNQFDIQLDGPSGAGSETLNILNFEHVTLIASEGADAIYGSAVVTAIYAGSGADGVFGGAGGDSVFGGTGSDHIFGALGNDVLFGGDDIDEISGGEGNNKIYGDGGNDMISAEAGDDSINGGIGDDDISAGDGRDTLAGGVGNDLLFGGGNGDRCYGNDGDDRLISDLDFLPGGADSLYGGAGNDVCEAGTGNDLLYGGAGNDLMFGGLGNDLINGGTGNDRILNDENYMTVVTATTQLADTLIGDLGDDQLESGYGDDRLFGGVGNDTLRGGSGRDSLFGGEGVDRFIFDWDFANAAGSRDFIYDYTAGEVISFTGYDVTSADISIATGATNTTITWWNGSIVLLNYTGAITFAYGIDAEIL